MAIKATYNRVKSEYQLMLQSKNSNALFGKEFCLPCNGEELLQMLEDNNLFGEFCYILYRLQSTKNYCLDEYEFYLKYQKDSSYKYAASQFSKDDLFNMCEMCKKFKYRTVHMIGILLYRGYEPNSIYEFFTEYIINDNRPEALESLGEDEEHRQRNKELIRSDKEQMRREQEIKAHRPLKDKVVRERIMYSPYSNWGLNYTVNALRKKDQQYNCNLFSKFISILYTLQYENLNLKIFDKDKFKNYVKNYWCRFYEEGEFCERAYGRNIRFCINGYKAQLEWLTSDVFLHSEQMGGLFKYKAEINRLKDYIKQLENGPYNNCEEFSKIIPSQEDCDELWGYYTNLENTLVFSIAILLHEKASDWKRILGYYLSSGEHVMIAETPIQDKEESNPLIVHPKLKKPIDKKIVSKTHKYKSNKTVSNIVSNWADERNWANLYHFLLTVFALQMGNTKLIDEDTFNDIFRAQIEKYKSTNSFELLSFSLVDESTVLKAHIKDKEEQLREIAVLIDFGYEFKDIYLYYNH